MATFQVRIEDLIGTVGDTAAESDWLTEGARIVADSMSPDRLELFAINKTDADGSAGISLEGGRAFAAHKAGYNANKIPIGMKAPALDGDSIHYAVSTNPSWYVDVEKGYVIPGGGVIKWFGYPTVLFSEDAIDDYPPEALSAVVLYAAILGQTRIISDLLTTTIGGLTQFTIVSGLPTIASPSFSYTKPSFGGSYTNIETALTSQDVALAQGENTELTTQMQEYATDIQNELNSFNSAVEEYKATGGEWNATLASYQAEVGKEVARIQSLIQQYGSMSQGYLESLKNLKEEFQRAVGTL